MTPYRESNSKNELLERLATAGKLIQELPAFKELQREAGIFRLSFLQDALDLNIEPEKIVFQAAGGATFLYYPYHLRNELRWIHEGDDTIDLLIFDHKGLLLRVYQLEKNGMTPLPYKKL